MSVHKGLADRVQNLLSAQSSTSSLRPSHAPVETPTSYVNAASHPYSLADIRSLSRPRPQSPLITPNASYSLSTPSAHPSRARTRPSSPAFHQNTSSTPSSAAVQATLISRVNKLVENTPQDVYNISNRYLEPEQGQLSLLPRDLPQDIQKYPYEDTTPSGWEKQEAFLREKQLYRNVRARPQLNSHHRDIQTQHTHVSGSSHHSPFSVHQSSSSSSHTRPLPQNTLLSRPKTPMYPQTLSGNRNGNIHATGNSVSSYSNISQSLTPSSQARFRVAYTDIVHNPSVNNPQVRDGIREDIGRSNLYDRAIARGEKEMIAKHHLRSNHGGNRENQPNNGNSGTPTNTLSHSTTGSTTTSTASATPTTSISPDSSAVSTSTSTSTSTSAYNSACNSVSEPFSDIAQLHHASLREQKSKDLVKQAWEKSRQLVLGKNTPGHGFGNQEDIPKDDPDSPNSAGNVRFSVQQQKENDYDGNVMVMEEKEQHEIGSMDDTLLGISAIQENALGYPFPDPEFQENDHSGELDSDPVSEALDRAVKAEEQLLQLTKEYKDACESWEEQKKSLLQENSLKIHELRQNFENNMNVWEKEELNRVAVREKEWRERLSEEQKKYESEIKAKEERGHEEVMAIRQEYENDIRDLQEVIHKKEEEMKKIMEDNARDMELCQENHLQEKRDILKKTEDEIMSLKLELVRVSAQCEVQIQAAVKECEEEVQQCKNNHSLQLQEKEKLWEKELFLMQQHQEKVLADLRNSHQQSIEHLERQHRIEMEDKERSWVYELDRVKKDYDNIIYGLKREKEDVEYEMVKVRGNVEQLQVNLQNLIQEKGLVEKRLQEAKERYDRELSVEQENSRAREEEIRKRLTADMEERIKIAQKSIETSELRYQNQKTEYDSRIRDITIEMERNKVEYQRNIRQIERDLAHKEGQVCELKGKLEGKESELGKIRDEVRFFREEYEKAARDRDVKIMEELVKKKDFDKKTEEVQLEWRQKYEEMNRKYIFEKERMSAREREIERDQIQEKHVLGRIQRENQQYKDEILLLSRRVTESEELNRQKTVKIAELQMNIDTNTYKTTNIRNRGEYDVDALLRENAGLKEEIMMLKLKIQERDNKREIDVEREKMKESTWYEEKRGYTREVHELQLQLQTYKNQLTKTKEESDRVLRDKEQEWAQERLLLLQQQRQQSQEYDQDMLLWEKEKIRRAQEKQEWEKEKLLREKEKREYDEEKQRYENERKEREKQQLGYENQRQSYEKLLLQFQNQEKRQKHAFSQELAHEKQRFRDLEAQMLRKEQEWVQKQREWSTVGRDSENNVKNRHSSDAAASGTGGAGARDSGNGSFASQATTTLTTPPAPLISTDITPIATSTSTTTALAPTPTSKSDSASAYPSTLSHSSHSSHSSSSLPSAHSPTTAPSSCPSSTAQLSCSTSSSSLAASSPILTSGSAYSTRAAVDNDTEAVTGFAPASIASTASDKSMKTLPRGLSAAIPSTASTTTAITPSNNLATTPADSTANTAPALASVPTAAANTNLTTDATMRTTTTIDGVAANAACDTTGAIDSHISAPTMKKTSRGLSQHKPSGKTGNSEKIRKSGKVPSRLHSRQYIRMNSTGKSMSLSRHIPKQNISEHPEDISQENVSEYLPEPAIEEFSNAGDGTDTVNMTVVREHDGPIAGVVEQENGPQDTEVSADRVGLLENESTVVDEVDVVEQATEAQLPQISEHHSVDATNTLPQQQRPRQHQQGLDRQQHQQERQQHQHTAVQELALRNDTGPEFESTPRDFLFSPSQIQSVVQTRASSPHKRNHPFASDAEKQKNSSRKYLFQTRSSSHAATPATTSSTSTSTTASTAPDYMFSPSIVDSARPTAASSPALTPLPNPASTLAPLPNTATTSPSTLASLRGNTSTSTAAYPVLAPLPTITSSTAYSSTPLPNTTSTSAAHTPAHTTADDISHITNTADSNSNSNSNSNSTTIHTTTLPSISHRTDADKLKDVLCYLFPSVLVHSAPPSLQNTPLFTPTPITGTPLVHTPMISRTASPTNRENRENHNTSGSSQNSSKSRTDLGKNDAYLALFPPPARSIRHQSIDIAAGIPELFISPEFTTIPELHIPSEFSQSEIPENREIRAGIQQLYDYLFSPSQIHSRISSRNNSGMNTPIFPFSDSRKQKFPNSSCNPNVAAFTSPLSSTVHVPSLLTPEDSGKQAPENNKNTGKLSLSIPPNSGRVHPESAFSGKVRVIPEPVPVPLAEVPMEDDDYTNSDIILGNTIYSGMPSLQNDHLFPNSEICSKLPTRLHSVIQSAYNTQPPTPSTLSSSTGFRNIQDNNIPEYAGRPRKPSLPDLGLSRKELRDLLNRAPEILKQSGINISDFFKKSGIPNSNVSTSPAPGNETFTDVERDTRTSLYEDSRTDVDNDTMSVLPAPPPTTTTRTSSFTFIVPISNTSLKNNAIITTTDDSATTQDTNTTIPATMNDSTTVCAASDVTEAATNTGIDTNLSLRNTESPRLSGSVIPKGDLRVDTRTENNLAHITHVSTHALTHMDPHIDGLDDIYTNDDTDTHTHINARTGNAPHAHTHTHAQTSAHRGSFTATHPLPTTAPASTSSSASTSIAASTSTSASSSPSTAGAVLASNAALAPAHDSTSTVASATVPDSDPASISIPVPVAVPAPMAACHPLISLQAAAPTQSMSLSAFASADEPMRNQVVSVSQYERVSSSQSTYAYSIDATIPGQGTSMYGLDDAVPVHNTEISSPDAVVPVQNVDVCNTYPSNMDPTLLAPVQSMCAYSVEATVPLPSVETYSVDGTLPLQSVQTCGLDAMVPVSSGAAYSSNGSTMPVQDSVDVQVPAQSVYAYSVDATVPTSSIAFPMDTVADAVTNAEIHTARNNAATVASPVPNLTSTTTNAAVCATASASASALDTAGIADAGTVAHDHEDGDNMDVSRVYSDDVSYGTTIYEVPVPTQTTGKEEKTIVPEISQKSGNIVNTPGSQLDKDGFVCPSSEPLLHRQLLTTSTGMGAGGSVTMRIDAATGVRAGVPNDTLPRNGLTSSVDHFPSLNVITTPSQDRPLPREDAADAYFARYRDKYGDDHYEESVVYHNIDQNSGKSTTTASTAVVPATYNGTGMDSGAGIINTNYHGYRPLATDRPMMHREKRTKNDSFRKMTRNPEHHRNSRFFPDDDIDMDENELNMTQHSHVSSSFTQHTQTTGGCDDGQANASVNGSINGSVCDTARTFVGVDLQGSFVLFDTSLLHEHTGNNSGDHDISIDNINGKVYTSSKANVQVNDEHHINRVHVDTHRNGDADGTAPTASDVRMDLSTGMGIGTSVIEPPVAVRAATTAPVLQQYTHAYHTSTHTGAPAYVGTRTGMGAHAGTSTSAPTQAGARMQRTYTMPSVATNTYTTNIADNNDTAHIEGLDVITPTAMATATAGTGTAISAIATATGDTTMNPGSHDTVSSVKAHAMPDTGANVRVDMHIPVSTATVPETPCFPTKLPPGYTIRPENKSLHEKPEFSGKYDPIPGMHWPDDEIQEISIAEL